MTPGNVLHVLHGGTSLLSTIYSHGITITDNSASGSAAGAGVYFENVAATSNTRAVKLANQADGPSGGGVLEVVGVSDDGAFYTYHIMGMDLTSGNVGIGTNSPQQNLTVLNGMNIDQGNGNTATFNDGTSSGYGLSFGSNSGEGIASNRNGTGGNQFGLDFYSAYTRRMSISQAGNVGIGTATPATTLDVNGETHTLQFQISNGNVFSNMQGGQYDIGTNGSQEKQVTVTFPVAFTSTPKIMATAQGCCNYGDVFNITVVNAQPGYFVANVYRIDGGSWGQDLQMIWWAWQ